MTVVGLCQHGEVNHHLATLFVYVNPPKQSIYGFGSDFQARDAVCAYDSGDILSSAGTACAAERASSRVFSLHL